MKKKEKEKVIKTLSEQGIRFENIDLEDTIDFSCKQCGSCCSNRSDVILYPYDVYNIAKATGLTVQDVIDKYVSIHIGRNSHIPILTIETDKRNLCPFLKVDITTGKFKCSINDNKPGSCQLHPIGVVRRVNTKDDFGVFETSFIHLEHCNQSKDNSKPVKVKDFIKNYLDNLDANNLSVAYQTIVLDKINTEKLVKGIIDRDENYINKKITSESEKKAIYRLSDNTRKSIYKLYVQGFIMALYDNDINKSSKVEEFIKDKDNKIDKVNTFVNVILTTTSLLGVDILTETSKHDKTISKYIKDAAGFITQEIEDMLK